MAIKKPARRILAAFLILTLVLAACGSTSAPGAQTPLEVVVGSIPQNLNGALAVGSRQVTDQIDALILPRAFYLDASGNYVLDTRYVTSAEVVSIKPQVVVYKINTKAKWSDGHSLSAEDLIYTFEQQKRGANGQLPSYWDLLDHPGRYSSVGSVTANQAGNEVTVRFSTPDSNWRSLFDPILPAKYMQANGFVASMSLGRTDFPTIEPYKVESYGAGQVVLSSDATSGAPFSKVDFTSGTPVPGSAGVVVRASPALAMSSATGMFVPGTSLYRLSFNLATTSVWFRRAVAAGIDRTVLYQQVYKNSQARFLAFSPPGSNLFVSTQTGYLDSQGDYTARDYATALHDFILGGYSFSAAGYLSLLSGSQVDTLVYDGSDSTAAMMASLIDRMVSYLGAHVVMVREPDASALEAAISKGAFTMAITTEDMTLGPAALAQAYLSGTPSSTDLAKVLPNDPAQIIKEATAEIYPVASAKLFGDLDTQIWQEMATLPLMVAPEGVELSKKITDSKTLAAVIQVATGGGYESYQPIAYPS